jgi:hypothetical protein
VGRWYYYSGMSNLQLICDGTGGLCAAFNLQAQDQSGNPWPASGSATIDLYNSAFLASAGGDAFQIIPKITMEAGQPTQTVTATFNLTDTASGNALDPISISVDLVAPPFPPNQKATRVVITGGPAMGTGSSLSDPGSATISVSLT